MHPVTQHLSQKTWLIRNNGVRTPNLGSVLFPFFAVLHLYKYMWIKFRVTERKGERTLCNQSIFLGWGWGLESTKRQYEGAMSYIPTWEYKETVWGSHVLYLHLRVQRDSVREPCPISPLESTKRQCEGAMSFIPTWEYKETVWGSHVLYPHLQVCYIFLARKGKQ